MNSSEKSVLVTGSSRGIGRAIAIRLAGQGYTLVIHGRSRSGQLESLADEFSANGWPVRSLAFDITDRSAARQSLQADIEEYGIYYGVVHNAGIVRDSVFPFMEDHDWDDVLATNLDGFYNVLRPLVEPMILARSPGRVVVISSVSGITGNRGQVNYSAAKAGLIGAVKSLGLELARKRITVNCVAPGLIETDMTAELQSEAIIPYIPMRRPGRAEEVCGAVQFFLSEDAGYITRQTIAVDGGLS
jgi:3-oxoacyl-[acyl-carrier protein] reductase